MWAKIAIDLIPNILNVILDVEKVKGRKGKEKEDAASVLIKDILNTFEKGFNKDLLDDDEVEKAYREVVRATVTLMNIITKKTNPIQ